MTTGNINYTFDGEIFQARLLIVHSSFPPPPAPHPQDLREKLRGELSGDFGDLVDMMFFTIPELKANICYEAIKGAGTDEKALIEVICTSTNSEIEQLKRDYAKGR